jgi:F-type H+-transporting ATPase subunit b
MARALLIALMIAGSSSLALAEGEHAAAHAEQEADAHDQDGGHHGGPVTFRSIVTDTHMWAAALNFTLLLLVLRKLGGKGISEFLASRRATMESSINEAAAIKAKAEAKHEEFTKRLATLDAELDKLKADLQRAADEDKKRIAAEAEDNAKRLRAETESLIEQHANALSTEVRREVVEAAILAAQQVIAQSVGAADQQKLADGFRERIQAIAARAPRSSRPVTGGPS